MLTIPNGWHEKKGGAGAYLRDDGAAVRLEYPLSSKPWIAYSAILEGYLNCGTRGGRTRKRVFSTAGAAIAAIEAAERTGAVVAP